MAARTQLAPGGTGNLFLDSLPEASAAVLVPKLEELPLSLGTLVAVPGKPIPHVIFPMIGGVISAVITLEDGQSIEVSLTGWEGFYGVGAVLGDLESRNEAMVQLPNSILRLPTAEFLAALRDDGALNERALRYVQVTLGSVAQFSACNRFHAIDERFARWLLMAHDRVAGDEMFLTHEYLAMMLGVRRPAVSIAAGALDEAGLIQYRRGRIVVRDREGLEAASCECYAAANADFKRILGYDVRKAVDKERQVTKRSVRSQQN